MTVSGAQPTDSVTHIHVSILPQTPLLSRLPHHVEQSSLGSTAGLCRLSSLKNIYLFGCISVATRRFLSSCGSQAPERADSVVLTHGLRRPVACGISATWPGIEPKSPALEGGFLTTGPPGKSLVIHLRYSSMCMSISNSPTISYPYSFPLETFGSFS